MKRDTMQSIGAIILIVGIVATTFWYGNRQRQAQIKKDQTLSSQTAKPNPAPTPKQNPTPKPTPAPVVATSTSIPKTGAESDLLIPLGALVGVVYLQRGSKRSLKRSLLSS
ncbi:MAG: hypothetical protein ACHQUB_02080 [Candidatus Saccharimonadia bacterium]